ncbi:MAG: translocation/assembly module TamB domain-containing protein [Desulfamplus sp.]|nr:translocation/assembly module TamB domain-containing protein [Desulfamplus sp.]
MQTEINKKIMGKMEWKNLNISLLKGELFLENYRLSLNSDEIISVDKVHVTLDLSGVIEPFKNLHFTNINDALDFSNIFNLSKFNSNGLIIKSIAIDKPNVTLSMTSEKRVNIAEAFTLYQPKKSKLDEKPFYLPFNITVNQLNIKQGIFEYKNINNGNEHENRNNEYKYKENEHKNSNNENKHKNNFDSKKSESVTLSFQGDIKNILIESSPIKSLHIGNDSNRENAEENTELDKIILGILSKPTFDITIDAKIITSEFLESLKNIDSLKAIFLTLNSIIGLGKDNQPLISGNLSIHSTLLGSLNDPLFSCLITYPDGQIIEKKIKATLDVTMQKKEIMIKNLELEHGVADVNGNSKLQANGNISLAKAFPKGFLGEREKIDKITTKLHFTGENIDLDKLLGSKNGSVDESENNKKESKGDNVNQSKNDNVDSSKNNNFNKNLSVMDKISKIKGVASFKGSVSGGLNNPEIKVILKAENAGYQGYPLVDKGDFDFTFLNGGLNIKRFDISSCDSLIKLDGNILYPNNLNYPKNLKIDKQKPFFNISATSKHLNLAEILSQFNLLKNSNDNSANKKLVAILEANTTLAGTLDNPNITLNANGKNIDLMGQKIESATLKGGYQDHKTAIDSLIVEFTPNTSTTNYAITNTTTTNIKTTNNTTYSDKFNTNTNNKSIRLINNNVIQAKGFIDHKQKHKFKVDISSQGVELASIESIKKYSVIKGITSGSINIEGNLGSIKSSRISGDLALKQVKIVDKPFQDFTAKLELKDSRLKINGKLNFDIGANLDFKSKDFDMHAIFNKTELLPWFTFGGVKGIESGTVTGVIDIKGNTNNLEKLEKISGKCSLSELSLSLFNNSDIFAKHSDKLNNSDSKTVNKKMMVKAGNINAWINGKEFNIDRFKTILPENGIAVLSASGSIGGNIKAQANATFPVKFASLFITDMPDIKGAVKLNLNADIKPKMYIKPDYSMRSKRDTVYSGYIQSDKDMESAGYMKSNEYMQSGGYIDDSKFDATVELVNIGVILPVIKSSGDYSDGSGTIRLHGINGVIKADINKIAIPEITGKISDSRVDDGINRNSDEKLGANSENQNSKSGQFKLSGDAKLVNFMPKNIEAKLTATSIPINMIEDFTASFDTVLNFKGDIIAPIPTTSQSLTDSDSSPNPPPPTPVASSLLSGNILINNAQWTRDIHVEKTILSTLTDRLLERKKVRKEVNQKSRQSIDSKNKVQDNNVSSTDFDSKKSNQLSKIVENMKLNIIVKGKKPLIVDNNLAYMEIHPDIRIGGTALSPLVSGRSEINPGTINYQSTEFTLTRGIIDFVNPYKIEPELDIESKRKVRDWDITLSVVGTPDNISFKLTSDPRLEDGDIISLLLRGKTVTELISAEGGSTLSAASMLSQIAASEVSDKVKSATGLDIFEVGFGNTNEYRSSKNRTGSSISKSQSNIRKYNKISNNKNNDSEFEDVNVTVGKELTDRINLKYGTENKDGVMVGKTSAEYKFTDNVSVTGFQDSEGQFGGEIRYRLEFK